MHTIKSDLKEIEKGFNPGEFPLNILVEPSNFCNLKCTMCAHKDMKRPKGKMSMELYRKIVDEIASENPDTRLWVNFYGESLLMGWQLYYLIDYAKKREITNVGFNTNGTLLSDEMIDMLIDSGIDFVSIDMDAFSKDAFEKIRAGADRDVVYKNVHRFIERKQERNVEKPVLEVKIIEMNENSEEIQQIVDYWRQYPIRIEVREMFTWAEKIKADGNREIPERIACAYGIGHCAIAWDGRVAICGLDSEIEEEQGNVNNESIKEIWKRKCDTVLKKHIEHDFENLPEICKNCTDWMHVGTEVRINENGEVYNRNYANKGKMLS